MLTDVISDGYSVTVVHPVSDVAFGMLVKLPVPLPVPTPTAVPFTPQPVHVELEVAVLE
jgi:hypothetical protein